MRGEKGIPGSRGQEGQVGRPGLPGICYPVEYQNPQMGIKGEKGMQGDEGQIGKGSQGPTGEQGNKGTSGDQGETGDKGNMGDKGGPGDKGNKGEVGNRGSKGVVEDKGQVWKRIMILASRQATLIVYAHSFGSNIQLTWYSISNTNGQREVISVQDIVNGANQLIVPIQDLCDYTYEVVVTGQNTYTFQGPCDACVQPDGTRLECCSANQTVLRESDCGDDYYADILLLIDVSASMDTEHAFLRAFLPRFEGSLRQNCVGKSTVNQNQYTLVAFGSQKSEGKENPYFVGPNLNLGDSTQNVYFTIDIDDPSNVTDTIAQLPTIGEREDGYAATNFSITFAQLRENSTKFAILVTDELRTFFYRSGEEIAESSTLFNNFTDLGRSLYVDLLKTNNIIPIQIIDVTLSSGTTQCLGVSSDETCFYRDPTTNRILRLENTEVVNTAPNNALKSIHKDYLETALRARGYVWDLKVIRQNQTGSWDAITNAITFEILTRATEELTQCHNCRCLPGGMQCTIVPVEEQATCKCEKSFPGNPAYCSCIVQPDARVDYCRCRHIYGLSDATCQEIGNIDLV